MSEVRHTPGPWAYIDATQVAAMGFAPKCVIKAGDKQIASFSWHTDSPWFPTKAESQANARLIAAAPDLLEALKDVLRIADRATTEFDAARAAIAKATQDQTS